ncbi:Nicotinamidase-related amidase [Pseudorhodobacter antarcticus]|jgi:nicotinamidase-related amidase|uniref:Nicotinamidase-related amidase n=1 Tax=Pseudorhodobacter antarcticus TaxID=1077947 RepID=A0A1H8GYH4_9RHOB|nr:isochorismatase family cysteine hydrolase [Pseudorhodobacter antarcticus]SEN49053.1 Nicotinamidase-related amidase [Pseudorhodobacter antarcticus]
MTPATTALLTIDLQNDFLHPKGAYSRAGLAEPRIAALPDRIAPLKLALTQAGGTYISAQFTLVPGRDDEPLIAPHLKKLRPFLAKGDFAPGSFGHALTDNLAPADYTVEKVAYSAFYQTRLEYILRALKIDTLIIGGIVTNGGVASTVRDAHLRNIHTILLSDGCAAFNNEVHDATLISLGSVTQIATCEQVVTMIGGTL